MVKDAREIFNCISLAYAELNGESFPCPYGVNDKFIWITNEAPYCLLSHDSNGILNYINKCALRAFKYKEENMIGMRSSITADGNQRMERSVLLNRLHSTSIIKNVNGIRVDSEGVEFKIYDGIVWQVNKLGFIGQAGLVWLGERDEINYKSSWEGS